MKGRRLRDFLAGMLAMLLVAGITLPALADVGTVTKTLEYKDIVITLNGKPLALTDVNGKYTEPFAVDGTVYAPVRAIGEALDLKVDWDGENATARLTTAAVPEVVLITDPAGIEDESYNQASWAGVKAYCDANGLNCSYVEPWDDSFESYRTAIAAAVNDGTGVLICPGFMFEECIYRPTGPLSRCPISPVGWRTA